MGALRKITCGALTSFAAFWALLFWSAATYGKKGPFPWWMEWMLGLTLAGWVIGAALFIFGAQRRS